MRGINSFPLPMACICSPRVTFNAIPGFGFMIIVTWAILMTPMKGPYTMMMSKAVAGIKPT